MKAMKAVICVLLVSILATSAAMAQTSPAPARTPLRPISDCIRIDQINEWNVIDARSVTVRTGPKRYLVKLTARCPWLGVGSPGLLFRPNDANKAVDAFRICGEVGESVRSRAQPPCAIQSVRLIDAKLYDKLNTHAIKHGNGTEPPVSAH